LWNLRANRDVEPAMTGRQFPDRARRERFEGLAAEVYEPIQRYVRRRADPDLVDDVVADTLLALWRRLDDVPPNARLRWAYGVARRTLSNARRANRRHLQLVRRIEVEPSPQAASDFDRSLDPDLHTALGRLGDSDRELLHLWAWEQLEPAEIAVALGLTPNAASIRLHRAKKKLGEILEEVRKDETSSGHSHRVKTKEERS
jgi:RNA polymerase sigma-70 factor, ECF subfamily